MEMVIGMEKYLGTLLIVAACTVVLLIGVLRKKSEWLLNFILRGILGTIAIYFINIAITNMGFETNVGINIVTVLSSGFLGMPGVLALYGIGLYQLI